MHQSLLLPLLISLATHAVAATIVDPSRSSPTIQEALDAAASGDTVVVLPGTYFEHELNFEGKAVVLRSVDPGDPAVVQSTVIDGEFARSVFIVDSGEDTTTVIEGLTIQHGYGHDWAWDSFSGGIDISLSFPRITRCILRWNWAERNGGALSVQAGLSTLLVEECLFLGNIAIDGDGGAVEVGYTGARFDRCTFQNNEALMDGGAVYLDTCRRGVTVSSCTFTENEALWASGGAIASSTSKLTIEKSMFYRNAAGGAGAVSAFSGEKTTMRNCIVAGNTAGFDGGGMTFSSTSIDLSGVLVAGNRADATRGGGVFFDRMFSGTVANCTIVGNSAGQAGGGIYSYVNEEEFSISNTILWGNVPEQCEFLGTNTTLLYSNIEGGYPGTGNIDRDPLFMELQGLSYLLQPASPCVDTGDPSIQDQLSDRHWRWPDFYVNGTRSDMGAYGGPHNVKWWWMMDPQLDPPERPSTGGASGAEHWAQALRATRKTEQLR